MDLLQIEKKFTDQFKVKGYSDHTLYSYWWHCEQLFVFCKPTHPSVLSSKDVNDILVFISDKSHSFRNQSINGIVFLFKYVFNKKLKAYLVFRPKKEKTQPILLSDQELQSLFDACENLKHKAILSLAFSAGLRVSEIVNLKIENIDSKNMVIHIILGKGKKSRMTILNQEVLELLRKYFLKYKPKIWLFNGQIFKHEPLDTIKKYSVGSIQQIVKQCAARAGIKKRVWVHLLRHQFCTGILEGGGSVHDVQVTAGHQNIKTSIGYCHLSPKYISRISSPVNSIRL